MINLKVEIKNKIIRTKTIPLQIALNLKAQIKKKKMKMISIFLINILPFIILTFKIQL